MSSIITTQEFSDRQQILVKVPDLKIKVQESASNINDSHSSDDGAEDGSHNTHRTLRSLTSQFTIVGLLFFLGPGMFCALNGLGGGGLHNPGPANTANVAVYSIFAIVGFISGPVVTKIGFQASFAMGGVGYSLYASSLLSYKLDGNSGFLVGAGVVLGMFSSLMWTSQGAMLIRYPRPEERGRYISFVWGLFNLGAGLGSLVCRPCVDLNELLLTISEACVRA
jgi:MFS family permease